MKGRQSKSAPIFLKLRNIPFLEREIFSEPGISTKELDMVIRTD